jgi:hypothetical protein
MRSTESGAVLWKASEGTGKPQVLTESEPPKARALQWGYSPFSLTGPSDELSWSGPTGGPGRHDRPEPNDADSGCLLENGSPQRGLAFC